MKDFDAKQARAIVDAMGEDGLEAILKDIKKAAENDESVLHIYKPVKTLTITALVKKGFKVTRHPSIGVQKDDLYFSIYW